MANNESAKRKPSTNRLIVIGVSVISFVLGIVAYIVFKALFCPDSCTWLGVPYCECPYNLNKLSEAIEQLKATREQLKEMPEQFKQAEQLREVLEKLENTRKR
jgi:F420-0:gamma-glutamyl ligase-like protein